MNKPSRDTLDPVVHSTLESVISVFPLLSEKAFPLTPEEQNKVMTGFNGIAKTLEDYDEAAGRFAVQDSELRTRLETITPFFDVIIPKVAAETHSQDDDMYHTLVVLSGSRSMLGTTSRTKLATLVEPAPLKVKEAILAFEQMAGPSVMDSIGPSGRRH